MLKTKIAFATLALFIGFTRCTSESQQESKAETKQLITQVVPEVKITDTTTFQNDLYNYPSTTGALGVFDVPEMLVLSLIDSANSKEMSTRLVKNYALLEEDLNFIHAELNGPVGMLTYNNNVNNFVFESVLFIKKMPKVQPKRSKIVILEASPMLVYNFYGSYQNLFSAYEQIKRYCNKNDLMQTGPMREFYITDPEKEKDVSKWLTRIMLPVISMRKKPTS
ncbi:GyrI-like domain-containing protein [Aurantibacillus circumpalustris]|uniref:GyrI-like domain-containing protein n=1 Tax=Aurantibacillus circumpalustris TaxID=3036359 RepID=UPI00295B2584|nr:GyrI-like domain-containing protein [Aurantibacillus circumpalustris]